ncbi:MAG: enoyl-CoA hydratase [Chloroflexi bacterium]|nr:enoyl-CoA hydratase [Chloroflexota bacterium]
MVFEKVLYEKLENVARVTMNRPEVRNAQSYQMLRELDQAFKQATEDDEVRVIILAGAGPSFSAGHDLGSPEALEENRRFRAEQCSTVDGRLKYETEMFYDMCLRWREIPKPTIAQVQGYALMAGMMLACTCDLIIAAENAKFADMGTRWLVPSVEYFSHPWEFGLRKTKEMLFTGDFIDAQEAHRLGMVNRVVPLEKLEEETMNLAKRITLNDPFLLKLCKMTVNACQDAQGFRQTLAAAMPLHQLGHAYYYQKHGPYVPVDGSAKDFFEKRDARFKK